MSHSFNQITLTDKFGWHAQLLPIYEKLFAPFKEQAIRLLEIGTDGGGGLRMYEDYFPKAVIVGIDISPMPDAVKDQPRIAHWQRDAYSLETIQALLDGFHEFHIVLDDGPHTLSSQQFFVAHYPQLLAKDGIAIVEDIQDPAHIRELEQSLRPSFSSMVIDLRHIAPERYDNLLFVVFR